MNKIIFISNSLADINKVKGFAKKSGYSTEYYSKEEWKKNSKNLKKLSKNKKDTEKPNSATILSLPTLVPSLQTMDEIKLEAIKASLLRARGNVSKAAKILSIGRATLYRKIKDLHLNPESFRKQLNEEEVELTFKKTA
ncbi:MAG: hypothetical protein OXM55_07995 [Bdellovibrionales bacterium]|nr:hypothetical protein [Bdellovibrionales bacterium]